MSPLRKAASWFRAVYVWWTANEDPETIEGFLKLLDYFANRVGGLAVVAIVLSKIQAYRGSGHATISETMVRLVLPCVLLLQLGLVYALSRQSVRVELAIARKVFPLGRVPKTWGGLTTRIRIALSVTAFLGLYLSFAYFVDNILVASLCMFAIACIDFNTRDLIAAGIATLFDDPAFAPNAEDRDWDVIERRRSVVRWYLYSLPHGLKEAGRVVGCAVAVGLSVSSILYESEYRAAMAYVALIGTLATNEVITQVWRNQRRQRLRSL
jgi:hypothetical protein